MAYKVFFSYQSDIKVYCERFIRVAIHKAIREIKEFEIKLDYGMRGTSGNPLLIEEMLQKAKNADIVISDLTLIGTSDNGMKRISNPNVLLETGHAWSIHGYNRTLFVMNTAFGPPENLPVDLKGFRWPILYSLNSDNSEEEKKEILIELKEDIKIAIINAINSISESEKTRWLPFKILSGWSNSNYNEKYTFIEKYTEFKKAVMDVLQFKSKSIRLVGPPNCGKSRFLYELLNSEDTAPYIKDKILYCDCSFSEGRIDRITEKLEELCAFRKEKIIILDNLSQEMHDKITKIIENANLSLISLGRNDGKIKQQIGYIEWSDDMIRELINSIIENNYAQVVASDKYRIIEECGLNIEEILILLQLYKPQKKLDGIPLKSNLIDYYQLRELPEFNFLKVLSLFDHVGYNNGYEDSFLKLVHFFKLDIEEINRQIPILERRKILVKKGVYIIIIPLRLARELAIEFWNDDFISIYPGFIEFISMIKLIQPFIKRTKELLDSGNPLEFVKNISKTTLRNYDFLNTNEGAMLFMECSSIAPLETLDSLEVVFDGKTTEDLIKFDAGRRYIAWALERHVFRKELFIRAAKLLYRLAKAEIEEISNNTTGQFTHLFQPILPGTSASLRVRCDFLLEIAQREINPIIYKAFSYALKSEGYTRDGGAEKQFDQELVDYYPTSKDEIAEYQHYFVDFAMKKWINDGDESMRKILKQNILGFCLRGLHDLIFPFIKTLIEKEGLSNELCKDLIIVRNRFNGHVDSTVLVSFDNLLTKPFSEIENKFRMVIAFPPYNEYRKWENDYEKKFYELVERIVSDDKFSWLQYLSILLEGEMQICTIRFGEIIGKELSDINTVVNTSIDILKLLPTEKQNINLLKGIIRGVNDEKFTRGLLQQLSSHDELVKHIFDLSLFLKMNLNDFQFLLKVIEKHDLNIKLLTTLSPNDIEIEDFSTLCRSILAKELEGAIVCSYFIYEFLESEQNKIRNIEEIVRQILKVNLWELDGDYSYYNQLESIYLKWLAYNNHNSEEIGTIIEHLFDVCEKNYSYRDTKYYSVIEYLIENHFDIFFDHVAKALKSKGYSFKRNFASIVESYHKWNKEKIVVWCKETGGEGADFFLYFLPFGKSESKEPEWDDLFLNLMEISYDHPYLLDNVSSRLHSYGVTGSAVPLYKYRLSLIQKLKIHPIDEIRIWAIKEEERIGRSLDYERRSDENYIVLYH